MWDYYGNSDQWVNYSKFQLREGVSEITLNLLQGDLKNSIFISSMNKFEKEISCITISSRIVYRNYRGE